MFNDLIATYFSLPFAVALLALALAALCLVGLIATLVRRDPPAPDGNEAQWRAFLALKRIRRREGHSTRDNI
jgi:hypothetical protein